MIPTYSYPMRPTSSRYETIICLTTSLLHPQERTPTLCSPMPSEMTAAMVDRRRNLTADTWM